MKLRLSACALLLSFIALRIVTTGAEPQCFENYHRVQCGYQGISESGCKRKNCCYRRKDYRFDALCYFPNAGYNYCSNTAQRIPCQRDAISEHTCLQNGCCWNVKGGEPSCYFKNTNVEPARCKPAIRIPCENYSGAGRDACEGANCCWSPATHGSSEIECFKQSAPAPHSSPIAETVPSEPVPSIPSTTVTHGGQHVVEVSTVEQLEKAIDNLQDNTEILFLAPVFQLTRTLSISNRHILLKAAESGTTIGCPNQKTCLILKSEDITLDGFTIEGDSCASLIIVEGSVAGIPGDYENRKPKSKKKQEPSPTGPPQLKETPERNVTEEIGSTKGKKSDKQKLKGAEKTKGTNIKKTKGQKNDSLRNCASAVANGGFVLVRNSALVLEDCTFDGFYASQTGGVVYARASNIWISKSTFTNSAAGLKGGAVDIDTSTLNVEGSSFNQNKANEGGALSALDSSVNIDPGTSYDSNAAEKQGGAIHAQTTNIRIQSASFMQNKATLSGSAGGAISLDKAVCEVAQSSFVQNNARRYGGAIYVAQRSTLSVQSSSFQDNLHPPRYEIEATADSTCTVTGSSVIERNCQVHGFMTLSYRTTAMPTT